MINNEGQSSGDDKTKLSLENTSILDDSSSDLISQVVQTLSDNYYRASLESLGAQIDAKDAVIEAQKRESETLRFLNRALSEVIASNNLSEPQQREKMLEAEDPEELEEITAEIDNVAARIMEHQAITNKLENDTRIGFSELAKVVAEL